MGLIGMIKFIEHNSAKVEQMTQVQGLKITWVIPWMG